MTDTLIEEIAQVIYERGMLYLRTELPGWTPKGNSLAQDEARAVAGIVAARILADAAVIKAAEELANLVHDALEDGCDLCSGDCSSANPPVTYCPQKIRAAALAAFRKAQEAAK